MSSKEDISISAQHLEEIRQREAGKYLATALLFAGGVCAILAHAGLAPIYLIFAFAITSYGTYQWKYTDWMKATGPEFKRRVTTEYIGKTFPGLYFEPEIEADIDLISRSGLFTGRFVSVHAEDLVLGQIEEVGFKFFELRLHTTMSETGVAQPPFAGVFMQATFPRRLIEDVIIIPRRHITSAFKRNREKLIKEGFERVSLEEDLFNDAFEVWSKDEVEAGFALPIVFQERLVRLIAELRAPVTASIKGQDFFLAFESHYDLFEPDIRNFSVDENLKRAGTQIQAMVRLIQILRLTDTLRRSHDVG